MKCKNMGNYKYCKKRMKKTEIRYAGGKKVCANCFANQDKWVKK